MSYRNAQEPFSVTTTMRREPLVVLTRRRSETQIVGEETPFSFTPDQRDTLLPPEEEIFRQASSAIQKLIAEWHRPKAEPDEDDEDPYDD